MTVPTPAIALPRTNDDIDMERRWAVAVIVVVVGASIVVRRLLRQPPH